MERRGGQIVGNRYRLIRQLSGGGMGTVWEAEHVELGSRVALKVMARDEDDAGSSPDRFRREARAAAQLESEHVVKVHDFGIDDTGPYIAMELLAGEDLRTRLAREGALDVDEVLRITAEIVDGLEVAHRAGLVHRDLKPSNVFLARGKSQETVKILDFGVVKDLTLPASSEATSIGVVLGSPPYMSPEQARGRAVDHRTDVWALGAVVFEMLTGRRAFEGENLTDTVAKICSDPIPAARDQDAKLPAGIDVFFATAFCRDRDGRFQSADELFVALRKAVDDEVPTPLPGRDAATRSLRLRVDSIDAHVDEVREKAPTRRVAWGAAVVVAGVAIASLAYAFSRPVDDVEASTLAAPADPHTTTNAHGEATRAARATARAVTSPPAGSIDPSPPSGRRDEVASPDPPAHTLAKTRPRGPTAPTVSRRAPSPVQPVRTGAPPAQPDETGPAKPAVDPVFGLPVSR